MKNLAFALSININPVVVLPTHQIIEIGIKDESLGYIYVENNNTQADCVFRLPMLANCRKPTAYPAQ